MTSFYSPISTGLQLFLASMFKYGTFSVIYPVFKTSYVINKY